jgi:uncharacterized protein (TIGR02246 family)
VIDPENESRIDAENLSFRERQFVLRNLEHDAQFNLSDHAWGGAPAIVRSPMSPSDFICVGSVEINRENKMMTWTYHIAGMARRSGMCVVAAVCLLSAVPTYAADSMGGMQKVEKPQSAIAEEARVMHTQYLAAFNRRDSAAVAALFTKNATFVDAEGHVQTGPDAIKSMFDQAFQVAKITLEATADQVDAFGDGALETGLGAQVVEIGKETQRLPFHYAILYAREGGLLKVRLVSLGAQH